MRLARSPRLLQSLFFSATHKLLTFISSSECRRAEQSLNRGSSFLLSETLLFIADSDFRFTSLVLHYQKKKKSLLFWSL